MRAPVSWLAELVDLPAAGLVADPWPAGADVAADLVRVGLEEEALHGGDVVGPIVVGRVLSSVDEPQKNGKVIRWCTVDVGDHGQRAAGTADAQEIVCGAHNFAVGDLVVVVLPGASLPGGFVISARKTYGHVSNGMICSEAELRLGDDHGGILVLQRYLADDPARLAAAAPGVDAIALLGLNEEVVEVNVTPDRGYCFSVRGIAREYAAARGAAHAFRDPVGPDAVTPAPANDAGYPVRLADAAPLVVAGAATPGCDRYVARVVRGVDAAAPTPAWMARRLTQLGMRPISLAVDVTNYLMLLTGQPLHAFDLDSLSGSIEVRRARPGETLTTLDDVERRLDVEDLLITDGGDTPLAIAGVMGGATSEVGPATTNVLIEAAHFDPISIARSSRRHRLVTEASKRFERGVDPAMTAAVAQLAVDLLVEFGGGVADPGVTDAGRPRPPGAFDVDPADVPALIEPAAGGAPPDGLDPDSIAAALRSLGCAVAPAGGARLRVTPPTWRPDLRTTPDLVEEVARLRGYDRIPAILPSAPPGRGLTLAQRTTRLVSALLAAQGYTEVLTYPFVGTATFDALGYGPSDPRRRAVRLANPLSDEAPLLRTTVASTLLGAVRLNVSRGSRDVALFEVGLVTAPGADQGAAPVPGIEARPDEATLAAIQAAVPAQPRHVALAVAGDVDRPGPWGAGRAVAAADVIAAARGVVEALGLVSSVVADDVAPFHPGRCARIRAHAPGGEGVDVGHAGELHPTAVAGLELPARTCVAELDLDALVAVRGRPRQASPLSTYPVAHTDVALVVPEAVPAADVEAALRAGAGEALEAVRLFDVYHGGQLPAGSKSLAYRLSFRSPTTTLTTEEVNTLRDGAVAAAHDATGAHLRA